MTKLSLVLVMISAAIHPLWNMLLKQSRQKIVFYLHMHIVYTVLFSFILFLYPAGGIGIFGWIFVLLSAVTHFFYQIFLCRTYDISDMSLAYPIIRSSPIFVLILALVFLGEVPSFTALAGIFIVMAGVNILHQKDFSVEGFFKSISQMDKKAIGFALITAFASAVYSVVDKKGAIGMNPILFFYLFFSISGFMFLGYVLLNRDNRKELGVVFRSNKLRIAAAVILEFMSYALILYAFRISKVAYVVAFRQISVVFGALLGAILLKEGYGKMRIAGSIVIFIGIFLIAAFG